MQPHPSFPDSFEIGGWNLDASCATGSRIGVVNYGAYFLFWANVNSDVALSFPVEGLDLVYHSSPAFLSSTRWERWRRGTSLAFIRTLLKTPIANLSPFPKSLVSESDYSDYQRIATWVENV